MESPRDPSGPGEIASAAHLRALLDLARLLRADARLPEVMTRVAVWDKGIRFYTPEMSPPSASAGRTWHPEDALFARLDGAGTGSSLWMSRATGCAPMRGGSRC